MGGNKANSADETVLQHPEGQTIRALLNIHHPNQLIDIKSLQLPNSQLTRTGRAIIRLADNVIQCTIINEILDFFSFLWSCGNEEGWGE